MHPVIIVLLLCSISFKPGAGKNHHHVPNVQNSYSLFIQYVLSNSHLGHVTFIDVIFFLLRKEVSVSSMYVIVCLQCKHAIFLSVVLFPVSIHVHLHSRIILIYCATYVALRKYYKVIIRYNVSSDNSINKYFLVI